MVYFFIRLNFLCHTFVRLGFFCYSLSTILLCTIFYFTFPTETMASVSEALLVIVLFLLGMCLNSVTSDNQEEPVKFSVASQTLRSFNQHETSNSSSSNDSLDLRTAKHQRLNESFREPLVLSNHRKPSGRSSANLRDIKQLKTPKPPFRSLEFSNQHKQTASSSDNLVYANQRKHPRSPTNSLDFSNRHYGASTSSGDFSTSENSHVLPNFSKDLIRPHLSRSRKNFCPKHCRCTYCQDRTIYTVDCSNRGLRKIPDLPQTSRNVYLQNNDIEDVACRKMEHLKNLKELNLSQNGRIKLFNCSFATVNSLERLWLARCNLGSLPIGIFHSLRHLLELDLSENIITDLEAQLFSNMHELMSLNLSQNRLGRVRNNTFQGLGALVFLSLKENLLYYLAGTFETDAFQGLTSLKSLHLEGNQPNFREDLIYPDQALTRVPTLEYLWLDGFPRRLGPGFLSLRNISHLTFGSEHTGGYCAMSSKIPPDFFSDIATEKPLYLNLSFCNIWYIPPKLFNSLPTIHTLDLTSNHYMTMDLFENGSKGLENSTLTVLNISFHSFSFPMYSVVKNTTFQHLKRTNLKVLVVEGCYLVNIDPTAIIDLPQTVEYISFHDNRFLEAFFLLIMIRLHNLKDLILSRQLHFTLKRSPNSNHMPFSFGLNQSESERNRSDLIWPDIKNRVSRALNSIQNPIGKTPVKRELGIWSVFDIFSISPETSFNKVNVQSVSVFLPHRLELLDLSDIKLPYDIPRMAFKNNKVLKYLDLSANIIKNFNGPLYGLPSLEYLDLSRNYCQQVKPLFFSQLQSLRTLLLYQNILGGSLSADSAGVTFSKLALLQNLDLSSNVIKDLPEMLFKNNVNLKVLNLSNNALSCLRPSFAYNSKLEILDLSNNLLTGLSQQTCTQLLDIKEANSNFSVHISGNNKFLCNCDTLHFLKFLLDQPAIFENVASFSCNTDNGTRVTYSGLPELLPQLVLICVNQVIFVSVLSVFSVMLGSLAVCSLYHYKRWQWKYLFYLSRNTLHIGSTHINFRPAAHAFVTYDQVREI